MDPLKCSVRTETGSAACRRMRAAGAIPLNLYSKDSGNTMLAVNTNEFIRHQNKAAGEKIFPISFEKDGKPVEMFVLIKEQQHWAWKNQVVHLDLMEVRSGDLLEIDVPIIPFGECIGVKDGGILNHISDTIRVRCTMDKLPRRLQADISSLRPGHALHVRDIQLPEGVELVTAPEQVLITVVETRATKEEAAQQTAETAAAAEGTTTAS